MEMVKESIKAHFVKNVDVGGPQRSKHTNDIRNSGISRVVRLFTCGFNDIFIYMYGV